MTALTSLPYSTTSFHRRTFKVSTAVCHQSAAYSAPFQWSDRQCPCDYYMRTKPCAAFSYRASPFPGWDSSALAGRRPLLACHAIGAWPRSFCRVTGTISSTGLQLPSQLAAAGSAGPYLAAAWACCLPSAAASRPLSSCSARTVSMPRRRGTSRHLLQPSSLHFFLVDFPYSSAFDFSTQFLWKSAVHWVSSSTEQISTTTAAIICVRLSYWWLTSLLYDLYMYLLYICFECKFKFNVINV